MPPELPPPLKIPAESCHLLGPGPGYGHIFAGPGGLTPGQHRAISALLVSKSITEAARKAGVGVRSIFRWLRESEVFQQKLRESRRETLAQTVHRLHQTSLDAANALAEMTASPERATMPRVAAARTVLEFAFRASELEVADDRLYEPRYRPLPGLDSNRRGAHED